MATKNANDGLSMLAVVENATNDVTDMLHRMRELAVQASNGTNGSQDLVYLNNEVTQLKMKSLESQSRLNSMERLTSMEMELPEVRCWKVSGRN